MIHLITYSKSQRNICTTVIFSYRYESNYYAGSPSILFYYRDYHHYVGGQSQNNFASVFTYCNYIYETDKGLSLSKEGRPVGYQKASISDSPLLLSNFKNQLLHHCIYFFVLSSKLSI